MSAVNSSAAAASQQAVVEAALVLLERMGLSPSDLVTMPRDRKAVPTFAEYVPVVSASVTDGTRRYDHLWTRIGRHLSWVRTQQISIHWIRHTTLTS